MRCLFLFCSGFDYTLVDATPAAAQDVQGRSEAKANCAVAFVAAEKGDDERNVSKTAKEIRKWARKAQAECLVVNPFAHLTMQSASPDEALRLTRLLAERLRETASLPVEYSSFGWIKAFTCAVVGNTASQIWIEFPPEPSRKTCDGGDEVT